MPILTNSQGPEPGFFAPLVPEPKPEPLQKKIPGAGAGAAWKKNEETQPEPEKLKKMPGMGNTKLYISIDIL